MAKIEGWEIKLDEERSVFGGIYTADPADEEQRATIGFEFINTRNPEGQQKIRLRISHEALLAMNNIAKACGYKEDIHRFLVNITNGEWQEVPQQKDSA